MIDILAVCAHPDDLEVCAGGIFAKAKKEGWTTGLVIMTTLLGFNLLGDGLRDALDPKLKQ